MSRRIFTEEEIKEFAVEVGTGVLPPVVEVPLKIKRYNNNIYTLAVWMYNGKAYYLWMPYGSMKHGLTYYCENELGIPLPEDWRGPKKDNKE